MVYDLIAKDVAKAKVISSYEVITPKQDFVVDGGYFVFSRPERTSTINVSYISKKGKSINISLIDLEKDDVLILNNAFAKYRSRLRKKLNVVNLD